MTRTYAVRRLLEHGPLTFGEILEITRWPHGAVRGALANVMASGHVDSKRGKGRRRRTNVYRLSVARVRVFAAGGAR